MKLFISPHNDDETLFGAFTLLREKPLVVVVFDSYLQEARGLPITAEQRRTETEAACQILGVTQVFLGLSDAAPDWAALPGLLAFYGPDAEVWMPAVEVGGHEQHNRVGEIADAIFARSHKYLTYTRTKGKSRSERMVEPEPDWIARKHLALCCYTSQIAERSTRDHFCRDLYEYME